MQRSNLARVCRNREQREYDTHYRPRQFHSCWHAGLCLYLTSTLLLLVPLNVLVFGFTSFYLQPQICTRQSMLDVRLQLTDNVECLAPRTRVEMTQFQPWLSTRLNVNISQDEPLHLCGHGECVCVSTEGLPANPDPSSPLDDLPATSLQPFCVPWNEFYTRQELAVGIHSFWLMIVVDLVWLIFTSTFPIWTSGWSMFYNVYRPNSAMACLCGLLAGRSHEHVAGARMADLWPADEQGSHLQDMGERENLIPSAPQPAGPGSAVIEGAVL